MQTMKQKKLLAAALSLLLLTGCAENPDSDIIVHKDMEKLIDEAQQTGESKAEVADLQQNDRYTADFEHESLRVKVHADAEIEIPDVDRLSVYHVQKQQFTQDTADTLLDSLIGDRPLYDSELLELRTKNDLLPEIADTRERYAAGWENSGFNTEEDFESEMQSLLDLLQSEYDYLPNEISYADHPSDGRLHPVRELYERNPAAMQYHNAFYTKWFQRNPEGNIMDCITDGADGQYCRLQVINSPDMASSIYFFRTPLSASYASLTADAVLTVNPSAKRYGLPEYFRLDFDDMNGNWTELPDDSAALSQEDAQAQAEALFEKLGIEGFSFYEGGLFAERVWLYKDMYLPYHEGDTREFYYHTCRILRYFRNLDGCFLLPGGGKQGDRIDEYHSSTWADEIIEVRVNDSGIVGFNYVSPLSVLEKTVSDAALKPFSEIQAAFEKMAPMMTAHEIENFRVELDIDRVQLCYVRVSEKDSFDTGYAVPVWAFSGKRKLYNDLNENFDTQEGTFVYVNAVDGSVIAPGKGY